MQYLRLSERFFSFLDGAARYVAGVVLGVWRDASGGGALRPFWPIARLCGGDLLHEGSWIQGPAAVQQCTA